MSSDRTAKRRRERRMVENTEFDAFVRRIVRAYGRRVAAGDVEALAALRRLASTVEDATKEAVAGLRQFGYSWTEIAVRLGVTRQAAQMRWGRDAADRGRLDVRLLKAGMTITVPTLVEIFIDHHPGDPRGPVCPSCGFRYSDGARDCPTTAVVRLLLRRRRYEDPTALSRLPGSLYVELLSDDGRSTRAPVVKRTVSAQPAECPQPLFTSSQSSQKGVWS